jgi:hypothetical protein
MTDLKPLTEGHAATPRRRVECPVWHSPLYEIVPSGIVCKCRSCRGKTTHFKSREEIEQAWEAMKAKQG